MPPLLFKHRRLILTHWGALSDILTLPDIASLIQYSQEKYGSVDLPQARLLLRVIDSLKSDDSQVYQFITSLKRSDVAAHDLTL